MALLQSQPFGGTGTFNASNPVTTVPTISNPNPSLTSYNMTGLLPTTLSQSQPKSVAVVTSEPAKNTVQQQKAAVTDVVNTVAQNQATRAANPQVSIVDALNAQGKPSDFSSRAKMAAEMGVQNYTGTAAQNQQLIQMMNQPKQQPTTTTKTDNVTGASTTTTQQQGTAGVGTYGQQVTNPNTGNMTTVEMVGKNPDGTYTVTLADTPNSFRVDEATYKSMVSGKPANPQYQGQTGGVLSPFQQQTLNQWQQAYDNYNSTIQQIFNGTFLTPDQQAQIQATQATFDRIRSLQSVANDNYTKLKEQAGFRSGMNVTDPSQFLAQKQQAIQNGLDKIAQVDAAATKALAELKQSFLDKNYKMANDAYTNLSNYLKEKNNLIQKAVDDSRAMEKDVRNYNFEVQKHADTLRVNEENKISAIQAKAAENGAPLNIIEAIGNADSQMAAIAAAGKYMGNELENAYKQAQIDKIYNDIKTSGVGGMAGDPGLYVAYAQQYATNGQIPPGLPKGTFGVISQIAKELPKEKGQIVSKATGIYPAGANTAYIDGLGAMASVLQLTEGLKELNKERIGGVTGGTLGKIFGSDAQGDYIERRDQIMGLLAMARSGLAVTDREYKRYEGMLPTRFSDKGFGLFGRDSDDAIENFAKIVEEDLLNKATAKGYSIYGYSKVEMPDGSVARVGDIQTVTAEDGTQISGRVNPDGSITIIQ